MTSLEEAFAGLRGRGFEVTNLTAGRKSNPNHLAQLYELRLAARDGWPDPDPDPAGPAPLPLEWFRRQLDEVDHPDAFFIVSHAGRYVAFTSFFGIGTAVHPEYRGRGIATLLKAGSIADAQRRGFRGQTTNTANPAMRRVFEKLGYRRTWSEVRLLRAMG